MSAPVPTEKVWYQSVHDEEPIKMLVMSRRFDNKSMVFRSMQDYYKSGCHECEKCSRHYVINSCLTPVVAPGKTSEGSVRPFPSPSDASLGPTDSFRRCERDVSSRSEGLDGDYPMLRDAPRDAPDLRVPRPRRDMVPPPRARSPDRTDLDAVPLLERFAKPRDRSDTRLALCDRARSMPREPPAPRIPLVPEVVHVDESDACALVDPYGEVSVEAPPKSPPFDDSFVETAEEMRAFFSRQADLDVPQETNQEGSKSNDARQGERAPASKSDHSHRESKAPLASPLYGSFPVLVTNLPNNVSVGQLKQVFSLSLSARILPETPAFPNSRAAMLVFPTKVSAESACTGLNNREFVRGFVIKVKMAEEKKNAASSKPPSKSTGVKDSRKDFREKDSREKRSPSRKSARSRSRRRRSERER